MKNTLKMLLAAGALAVGAQHGLANTIVPGNVSALGGLWVYDAVHKTGELHSGDGFTIFDFNGYVSGSAVAPANWTVTSTPTGSPFGPGIGSDQGGAENLHFTYTGPTIQNAILGSQTVFTGFSALTLNPDILFEDSFSSRDHGVGDSLIIGDGSLNPSVAGSIFVPASVPDGGATAMLLGLGFIGAAALRRKVG